MYSKFLGGVCLLGMIALPAHVQARPVSYPGGWSLMQNNDGDSSSLHVYYSPTARYSVGYLGEYMREQDYMINGVQANVLLKRWNNDNSQGNLYLQSIAGVATRTDGGTHDSDGSVSSGILADWETRRIFTSYENRGLLAGDIDKRFTQKVRVGIAPYVAEYGGVHTWLMLEARHEPKAEDSLVLTPLVRVFKGPALVEAGISEHRDILFNVTYRF